MVATTGRRLDPDELGPVPPNVVVEEFVPQDAVLARADLLVSHSGSGTMLGGLVHGVPQVALPRGTDQPQNAALLARALRDARGLATTAETRAVLMFLAYFLGNAMVSGDLNGNRILLAFMTLALGLKAINAAEQNTDDAGLRATETA